MRRRSAPGGPHARRVRLGIQVAIGRSQPTLSCSVSCGGGRQTRSRPVVDIAAYGGRPCGQGRWRVTRNVPDRLRVQRFAGRPGRPVEPVQQVVRRGSRRRCVRSSRPPSAVAWCPKAVAVQPCEDQACDIDCQVSQAGGRPAASRAATAPRAHASHASCRSGAGGSTCPPLDDVNTCNSHAWPGLRAQRVDGVDTLRPGLRARQADAPALPSRRSRPRGRGPRPDQLRQQGVRGPTQERDCKLASRLRDCVVGYGGTEDAVRVGHARRLRRRHARCQRDIMTSPAFGGKQ